VNMAIRITVRALAILPIFSIVSTAEPVGQTHMVNEDSHPHEVQPGAISRFIIQRNDGGGKLDVKCTLSGPVGPVRLIFQGVVPTGWAVSHTEFHIGAQELNVDIEGDVKARGTAHFDFVNDDPARLLWHQCYNN
jgi:hypothetical protein